MSNQEPKYVFVCGLHRSGTTVLAREIGKLKKCTAFANTGVRMDEGQFLQDVYPASRVYGGPGRFGFARGAHLTETSPLLTQTNVRRLRRSWEAHWDSNKTIRVEKTPGNLLMTRFLQAAFQNAYFVVIKRHPVAVSLATRKWSETSIHSLFEHWLVCHRIFDEDKKHLKHVYELRYKNYVANPTKYIREIASFIGTQPSAPPAIETGIAYNKKYFDEWAEKLQNSPFRMYHRLITSMYEKKFAPHGYSLVRPLGDAGISISEDTFARHAAGVLLCRAADAYSFIRREVDGPKSGTRRILRRLGSNPRSA